MSGSTSTATQAHVDLMMHYAEALDSRDWTLFASLFTPTTVFEARMVRSAHVPTQEIMALTGVDAIVAKVSAIIESLSATHHLIGQQSIDVAPEGQTGKASCYFRAYHAGADERAHLFEESLGRFDIQTVRHGSEWKIERLDEEIMIMLGTPDAFGVGPD